MPMNSPCSKQITNPGHNNTRGRSSSIVPPRNPSIKRKSSSLEQDILKKLKTNPTKESSNMDIRTLFAKQIKSKQKTSDGLDDPIENTPRKDPGICYSKSINMIPEESLNCSLELMPSHSKDLITKTDSNLKEFETSGSLSPLADLIPLRNDSKKTSLDTLIEILDPNDVPSAKTWENVVTQMIKTLWLDCNPQKTTPKSENYPSNELQLVAQLSTRLDLIELDLKELKNQSTQTGPVHQPNYDVSSLSKQHTSLAENTKNTLINCSKPIKSSTMEPEPLSSRNAKKDEKMEIETQGDASKNCLKVLEMKIEKLESKIYQHLATFKERNEFEISTLHQKLSTLEIDMKTMEKNLKQYDDKKAQTKKEATQIQNLEKCVLGLNKKFEEILWIRDNLSFSLENLENIEHKIGDIEGWMLATTEGLNYTIIPNLARANRAIEGVTRRIDSLYRFRENRPTFDGLGNQLTLRTDQLKQAHEATKKEPNKHMDSSSKFLASSRKDIYDHKQTHSLDWRVPFPEQKSLEERFLESTTITSPFDKHPKEQYRVFNRKPSPTFH